MYSVDGGGQDQYQDFDTVLFATGRKADTQVGIPPSSTTFLCSLVQFWKSNNILTRLLLPLNPPFCFQIWLSGCWWSPKQVPTSLIALFSLPHPISRSFRFLSQTKTITTKKPSVVVSLFRDVHCFFGFNIFFFW